MKDPQKGFGWMHYTVVLLSEDVPHKRQTFSRSATATRSVIEVNISRRRVFVTALFLVRWGRGGLSSEGWPVVHSGVPPALERIPYTAVYAALALRRDVLFFIFLLLPWKGDTSEDSGI